MRDYECQTECILCLTMKVVNWRKASRPWDPLLQLLSSNVSLQKKKRWVYLEAHNSTAPPLHLLPIFSDSCTRVNWRVRRGLLRFTIRSLQSHFLHLVSLRSTRASDDFQMCRLSVRSRIDTRPACQFQPTETASCLAKRPASDNSKTRNTDWDTFLKCHFVISLGIKTSFK